MTRKEIWEDFIVPIGGATLIVIVVGTVIGSLILALYAVFGPTPEQRAELNKPRIVSKFEDCEIWIFENTHYVTRCGNHTVTERHYSESCGKACTRQKVERIENDDY
jgi:hypothetical protein